MSKIAFFNSCRDHIPAAHPTVREVLDRIRSGEWASIVTALRGCSDPEVRKQVKTALPAVTISIDCQTRAAGAEQHITPTGLIQIDVDHDCSPATIAVVREAPFVLAAWRSPSGDGIKAVAKVKHSGTEAHGAAFAAVQAYFQQRGVTIDKAISDRTHLMFVSHDPDLWMREDAVELDAAPVVPEPPTALQPISVGPCPEWSGPTDDDELIALALRHKGAASILGGKASFEDLWLARADVLGATWPAEGRAYDASSADASLAQHLAYWTGRDGDRMLRLMLRSGLVREKWRRADYLPRTIAAACARCSAVLQQRAPVAAAPVAGGIALHAAVRSLAVTEVRLITGVRYMPVMDQVAYFDGCTYVKDLNKILMPDGFLADQQQFRAMLGGWIFALDTTGEKTTKNAWEAFLESQGVEHRKVDGIAFRPDRAPLEAYREGSRWMVNTYIPEPVRTIEGDITPFMRHLAKVLPVQSDQEILLAYMAAVVQHKGIKFQWAPLLQGAEGNGKTLFTRCVAYAVGKSHTHMPQAYDIANKFNSWLLGKIFIGVEDIFVPDQKMEVLEVLKPMITAGDGIGVQLKGKDQFTADICCNFILNSNHRDAIRKSENDRRFAIFYTAQQGFSDIARDGMGGTYFPRLYEWLKGDGYAIVADFLNRYVIPDHLNPATGAQRAPMTSSHAEVIAENRSPIEQDIMTAIDEDRMGFCGGWISSIQLQKVIGFRKTSPHNLARILAGLGYARHPGLTNDGKAPHRVSVDNGRPRLYIHNDSPHVILTDPKNIVKIYEQDQIKNLLA